MGLRGRAILVGAMVTALGVLVYCLQWSGLQVHRSSPWQPMRDGSQDCAACGSSGRSVKESAAEESLRTSADLGYLSKDRNSTLPAERMELHWSPPLPCKHPSQVAESQADILSHGRFIAESKTPCWRTNGSSNVSSRLHCLPYFFLAGISKCGSTDIFSRLSGHPQVVPPSQKEPRWFDWKRFVSEGNTFSGYVSNFMQAAWQISRELEEHGTSAIVVGDGSPTYFWRNFHWLEYPGNEGCVEPRLVIADTIHRLLPHAKIIVSLRNPVNSIYSKYLTRADRGAHCSPEHFHSLVQEEVERYRRCFAHASVRSCAYNISLSEQAQVRLEKGLYVVYLSDWLRVFPRKQLHVIHFEDYVQDIAGHLRDLFGFLELEPMPDKELGQLSSLPARNQGRHYSVGQMLPATRQLLQRFYAPFNAQLAHVMHSQKYLWNS